MNNLAIISGSSNEELAQSIADKLNLSLTPTILEQYSSGETRVEILKSVRNKTVFIVQSGYTNGKDCPSPNDFIMETVMLADACFYSSALKIYLLMPCIPYSNDDSTYGEQVDIESIVCQNDIQRWVKEATLGIKPETIDEPILYKQLKTHQESMKASNLGILNIIPESNSFKLVARLLTCTGINKILTFALPRPQLVGYFDIPVDELSPGPIISAFLKASKNLIKYTVAISDLNLAKEGSQIAKDLNFSFALSHKLPGNNEFSFSGTNFTDKNILLIDTFGPRAFETAKAFKNHASSTVSLLAMNFLLNSDDEFEFLANIDVFDEVFVTNSVRIPEVLLKSATNIKIVDLSDYFAEAIKCIVNGYSLKEYQNRLLE